MSDLEQELEDVRFRPSSLKEKCEDFLQIYREYQDIKLHLEQTSALMGMLKDEILNEYDSEGIQSMDMGGGIKLGKVVSTHPIVKDFDGLSDYIKNVLDEPLGEYMKMSFDTTKLKELIDDCKKRSVKEGVPVTDLLPKGLEISLTTSLRVTGLNKKTDL